MAKVSLLQFDPKLGFAFYAHGFADSAEMMFKMAFGIDPATLDQQVLADINETRTLYYYRFADGTNMIQYQSTLDKLKTELKEIGEL
ncbi:hypothetical protein AVU18_gp023 [Citrobacter phage IME-CF2]|jgi:hypothetical protein|uniref:Uncharacterized protein n=3 Tax=Pseudotevenvirus TaxID=2842979 RepID=A0A1B1IXT3_9CAUD|nr:hypothetical protein CPTMiller_00184 [Citrobacter phage Miller]YP_009218561.1 hypothetical protein AVU18_gp023 [Citrobacter phage IME-CF2]YP_009285718.1 hypothetical protein BI032_gp169 [Citrobacter phage vB_CfrM_CfP1]QPX73226.1 hypothetical protein [Citrobacter phage vB_Cfr_Xman]AIK68120.1 hypothetical protein CPTMiller_00184 [Citrobacter phage Miller]AKR15869.1 hypothetical protein [Citrobacter phage IME-CF2]ANS06133.1 hypothetical protein ABCD_0180 [Citrobacter phage vB_CfrM_CfP1]